MNLYFFALSMPILPKIHFYLVRKRQHDFVVFFQILASNSRLFLLFGRIAFSVRKRHLLCSKALLSMLENDNLGDVHGYSIEMKCVYAEDVWGE